MKYIYRIYQFLFALPVLLALTAITSIFTIIGCTVGNPGFWSYWPARCWSRAMCTVLLLPVRVRGKEFLQPGTSYVFAPNHQGAFDIFLVYGYLGRHFKWMMKKSLRSIPLVGRACQAAGHIFVDKSGPKATANTMDMARRTLTSGISIVAFPEGERTKTGKLGAFRRGAFALACDLSMPVVPVVIGGSYTVLPPQRGFWFVCWSPLTLTILPPIQSKGKTSEDLRTMTREAIVRHCGE